MAILTLEDISQEFGGLRALDHVHINVEELEIYGIIGPNGAGKTTLFNLISGIYIPTEGRIWLHGQNITRMKTHHIARKGIARTFQNIRLFGYLSVLDNVKVGQHAVTKKGFFRSMLWFPARAEEKLVEERSEELLKLVGLYDKRLEYARGLSYGEQRRLEIVRALALQPSLLLLDEPAAGMNPNEKEELMQLIRMMKQEMKITILLVEHDMNLVMEICERIAVLNYGEKIAEGTPEEIKRNERVIESYLGG